MGCAASSRACRRFGCRRPRPAGEPLLHHAVLERVVREHEHAAAGTDDVHRSSRPSARFGSSRLTSMRIAWNVRRAGMAARAGASRPG